MTPLSRPVPGFTSKMPDWADVPKDGIYCIDLDELWLEETDPENEFGECCTGFCEIDDLDGLHIVGIAVYAPGHTMYAAREKLIDLIPVGRIHLAESIEAQNRIDNHHPPLEGDDTDDRYDEWKDEQ